jgi:hypothetical protein
MKYHKRICKFCNEEFLVSRSNLKKIFCNKKCSGNFKSQNKTTVLKCIFCLKDYKVPISTKDRRKYCSKQCKDIHQCELNKGSNNPNYGNSKLKGIKRTPDKIKKISNGALKSWATEERKNRHKIFMERYFSQFGYYPMNSPESMNKAKETLRKKMSEGDYKAKTYRGICGYYVSKKTNQEEYYHSSYELIRMQELDMDSDVLTWTKKHKICIHLEGKHWYIPDILIEYVNNEKVLEEIKGYIRDEDLFNKQIEAAKKYCEEKNIIYKINYMKHLKYGKNKN